MEPCFAAETVLWVGHQTAVVVVVDAVVDQTESALQMVLLERQAPWPAELRVLEHAHQALEVKPPK